MEKEKPNVDIYNDVSIQHAESKQCKKCGRMLPNTYLYFPVDKACRTGLRNVCRECDPKYAGFLEYGYEKNKPWSEDEDMIIKNHYKDYTGKELQQLFLPNRSIRAIESRGSVLGCVGKTDDAYKRGRQSQAKIVSEKGKGRVVTEEQRQRMSLSKREYFKTHDSWWKGKHRSEQQIAQMKERVKGKWAGDKNPRHITPLIGDQNGNWKGGITPTMFELRSDTKEWQQLSMDFCQYRCVITGNSFDVIHHTYPFRDIVNEVYDNLGIDPCECVQDFQNNDFTRLRNEVIDLHQRYGYGACLHKDVHNLFHKIYGYYNFTQFDFIEFVSRITNGEFNKWFMDNNLQVQINNSYIEYLKTTLSINNNE